MPSKISMMNFDFASLYPQLMRTFNDDAIKIKMRLLKINKIRERMLNN